MTKLYTKKSNGDFEEVNSIKVYVTTNQGYGDDLPSEVFTEQALIAYADEVREENHSDFEPITTLEESIEYLSEYNDIYVEESEVIL